MNMKVAESSGLHPPPEYDCLNEIKDSKDEPAWIDTTQP